MQICQRALVIATSNRRGSQSPRRSAVTRTLGAVSCAQLTALSAPWNAIVRSCTNAKLKPLVAKCHCQTKVGVPERY